MFDGKSEARLTAEIEKQDEEVVAGPDKCSRKLSSSNDNELIHPKVVGTLMASGAGLNRPAGVGSELDFVIVQKIEGQTITRRLHPIECERLQGFPDNWTNVKFKGKPPLDTERYKTLGNSMATPCMRFIGIGLLQYHQSEFKKSA
nr:DNA cytosine methyltransferase [Brucella anthropi]